MPRKIKSLQDISEYQLCCGCGVCAYMYPGLIRMDDFPAYGRRPVFAPGSKGVREKDALEICPGYRLLHLPENSREEVIKSLEGAWGPILEIWEGYAADSTIRYKGSSGGAVTALALHCLEQEGISGVLQVQSDDDQPHLNKTVFNTSRSSTIKATGSRYSPASPCEALALLENADAPGMLVGKPCDIAAVHNIRKLKPQLREKIFVTIACFCAGTPSTHGTLALLKQMGVTSPEDLTDLRYRGNGWPGKTTAAYSGRQGLEFRTLDYDKAWGEILQKYRQWRCRICPDHTGEFADISIGDPWYRTIEDGESGQSMILVRTRHGRDIVKQAVAQGYIVAEKIDPSLLGLSQPHLFNARKKLWGQLLGLKLSGAPCPIFDGFGLKEIWKNELTITEKAKSILGTMRRVIRRKINIKQKYQ